VGTAIGETKSTLRREVSRVAGRFPLCKTQISKIIARGVNFSAWFASAAEKTKFFIYKGKRSAARNFSPVYGQNWN
jgi:hypothetical protein